MQMFRNNNFIPLSQHASPQARCFTGTGIKPPSLFACVSLGEGERERERMQKEKGGGGEKGRRVVSPC